MMIKTMKTTKKSLFMLFISLIFLAFFASCASNQSYETASFKTKSYVPNNQQIALNPNGLTAEQIKIISNAQPPKDFPIDVSVIFLTNGYISSDLKHQLQHGIIQQLKANPNINRITIIPSFIVPHHISFSSLQELGIRSLSTLVLVFNINSNDIFQSYKFLDGSMIKVTSTIDYMILDSFSSAILTTERLFSEKTYKEEIFKDGEKTKATKEIFKEQAELLGKSIHILFESAKSK